MQIAQKSCDKVCTLGGSLEFQPDSLSLFFKIGRAGTVPSRSGYEAAENLQKGAVSPIFSLLKAIFK